MRIDRFVTRAACALIVLLSLLASPSRAAEEVQLILIERDPWLMVVGSDTPTFVLYGSNRAIWRSVGEDGPTFFTTVLSDKESRGLLSMAEALLALDEYMDLTDWTDQPVQEIYFRSSGRIVGRTISGALRSSTEAEVELNVRQLAPASFLKLFDALAGFDHKNAEPWAPEFLEVMIWPYEYAPDASIEWPADWPDIDWPTTKRRGDSYSIYVPHREKERLFEFLRSRNAKGAVLINDRKWAASVRIPLPHELDD